MGVMPLGQSLDPFVDLPQRAPLQFRLPLARHQPLGFPPSGVGHGRRRALLQGASFRQLPPPPSGPRGWRGRGIRAVVSHQMRRARPRSPQQKLVSRRDSAPHATATNTIMTAAAAITAR